MTGETRKVFANPDVDLDAWIAAKNALRDEDRKDSARILRIDHDGDLVVEVSLFKVYNDFRFNLLSDERVEARMLFLYHPGFCELTAFVQSPTRDEWTMLPKKTAGAVLSGRLDSMRDSMRT